MRRQLAHVRQSQLPFAAQNHRTQHPVRAQQAGQIRHHHPVSVQQMLQRIQRGHFGGVQLRVLPVFDQAAEQVKIVLLVPRQFVPGHCVSDFRRVVEVHLDPDGARHVELAQGEIVLWQVDELHFRACRFHKVDVGTES